MAPSIVRNEGETNILGGKATICIECETLSIGGEGLHIDFLVSMELSLAVSRDEVVESHGAESELRFLVEDYGLDIKLVVWPFCAIYQWTTLYFNHTTVGFHIVVSSNGASLHVEVNFHYVALLPFSFDSEIAILGELGIANSLTINGDAIAQSLAVAIAVEVCWHYLSLNPSWNTDLHSEFASAILIDIDADVAIVRVACVLSNSNGLASNLELRRVAEEEVYVETSVLNGIYIAWQ